MELLMLRMMLLLMMLHEALPVAYGGG